MRTRLSPYHSWSYFVFALVIVLVAAPLLFLVLGSFSTASLPTDFSLATMGVINYITVYGDPGTYELFTNTILYVAGSVSVGIVLAATLAWSAERTDMPGKVWIYAGVPMTLAVPGMLQAMAWVLLLSPRIGFLNKWAMYLFDLDRAPINIYSLGGMIFIEGLRLVPTAFLMLVPLLRSMDPALEEAAAVSGARPVSALRKVTLRLLAPGMVAVMIYQAMTALEVFEIPGILGLPAGIYVFSTKIYAIVHSAAFVPVYGQANALAMVYLVIAIVTTHLYSRMIARSEKFAVITGKGYRPREIKLGLWRYGALALALVYILLAVVLPFLVFLYTSFIPYIQAPSWDVLQKLTLRNYRVLGDYGEVGSALKNTLVMVGVTATATTVLSFLISLVVVRSKFWGRKVLDQLAFIPHAIPGIVMGLAFFWVFLKLDFLPIYGTIWAMAIGFTVNFISYGTRSMNAGILQIHKELEEAAYVRGAPAWRTMWRVFFPLMLPTFIGVWIWVVLHAVRTLLPRKLRSNPDLLDNYDGSDLGFGFHAVCLFKEVPMGVDGLAHFGLEVSDVERSARFFTEVFRAKELKRLGFSEEELKKGRTRHVMVEIGKTVVALFESRDRGQMQARGAAPDNPPGWSSWRHFAFQIPPQDLDDWIEHLRAALPKYGESADGPKAHGGGSNGLSVYFDDPDGYHLEIVAYFPDRQSFLDAHKRHGRVFGGAKGENYTWTDEDEKKHYGRAQA